MQKEILSFSKMHVDGDLVITATQDELLLKDGRVLKDTMSGLWNVTLGYSNNNIKQSMMNQLVKLPYASNFSGYHSETTEKYAEEICKRTNMSRVYFTNSGSAAVETAIKLTGKEIAVCGKHSYHGSTILSANASDQDINKFWGIQNPMSVHKFEDVEDLIIQLTGKSIMEKSSCINEIREDMIPLFKKDSNSNKILFDIQAAATLQLCKEGIKRHQISLNRSCTYSNPKLFNSYRRDKTNLRQWSCIYS